MEEVNQAVNTAEPAPVEQEVVNAPVTDQQEQVTQPEPQTASPQTEGSQPTEAVDEFGVPYKNRMFEWKRKYEESVDKMPSLVEEAVKSSFQQYGKQQQKEPTIAELEQFAQENPQHRPFVEEKKAELLRKQIRDEFQREIKTVETKKEAEVKKQQAFNYVVSNYPDVFVKNPQGQVTGINLQNPLARQIDIIMKDPRLASDPEGLMIAADIAYARVSRNQMGAKQMNEQKLKAEVKQLQKATLVEGGAKQNVQSIPEYKKAIERAKQTGSLRDLAAALSATTKAKKESLEK